MSAISLNEKRQIVIELHWLLEGLSADQKRELIDSLACEESVIEDVSAQLLDGWTERSSHGSKGSTDIEPRTALSRARRTIAMRASEVAADEIEDLKRALKHSKACEEHYSNAYFKLYHAWPHRDVRMPEIASISSLNTSSYTVVKNEVQS